MALAMSGATCLLSALAVSMLRFPGLREQRALRGPPTARELEIQLVALAPRSDAESDAPSRREARELIAAASSRTEPRRHASERPRATPLLLAAADPATAPDAPATPAVMRVGDDSAPRTGPVVAAAPSSETGEAAGRRDEPRTRAPRATSVEVIPFGDGMTRPRLLAGTAPAYTAQALAARIEGKVIVRCVITESGAAHACRIVKSLPLLDREVLRALGDSRFVPATFRGQSVAVTYLFTFDFRLP